MLNPRTVITPTLIARDIARLTGARRVQIVLAYASHSDMFQWHVWIDGKMYRPPPFPPADLDRSLDDFQAMHLDGLTEKSIGTVQPALELPRDGGRWAEVWTPGTNAKGST